jgi:hypothetical protein
MFVRTCVCTRACLRASPRSLISFEDHNEIYEIKLYPTFLYFIPCHQ